MNENINLIEILKDAPRGTKLWSPICGDCYFQKIVEGSCYPIICTALSVNGNYCTICFTIDGVYNNEFADGRCALFPSKTNHDWSKLKVPKEHKHFEPFQKVLCIINDNDCKIWAADFYSHYDEDKKQHYLVSGVVKDYDNDILPYKGNENKLGKPVK